MFLSHTSDSVRVVLQTDHMAQVGDVARLWGNDQFLPARRPSEAFLAARLHDEGWRAWELDPLVDETTGLPLDFRTVPRSRHVTFYGYGADYAARANRYAGLLVSLHATGLYSGRHGVDGEKVPDRQGQLPEVQAFILREEARQADLRRALQVPEADVWHDYRLLQAWDRIGIFLARGAEQQALGPLPTHVDPAGGVKVQVTRVDEQTARLSPFPFAGQEQALPVKSFLLPARHYRSAQEFLETLGATAPDTTVFRVIA